MNLKIGSKSLVNCCTSVSAFLRSLASMFLTKSGVMFFSLPTLTIKSANMISKFSPTFFFFCSVKSRWCKPVISFTSHSTPEGNLKVCVLLILYLFFFTLQIYINFLIVALHV